MARYSGIFYTVGGIGASFFAIVSFAMIGRTAGAMWISWTGGFAVLAFWILLRGTLLWLAWRRRLLVVGLVMLPDVLLWVQWGWITPISAEIVLLVPVLAILSYSLLPGGKGTTLAAAVFVHLYGASFGWLMHINYAICRVRAATGPSRDLCRGLIYLRQGDLEQASAAFERHLRRSPNELAGLLYLTMAFLKLGRHGEALQYLDVAVQQGHHPDALAFRSLVLGAVGAAEEALQDIEAALLRQPGNRLYHSHHAVALVQAGRVEEALKVLSGPASPERLHLNWWPLNLALQERGDTAATADAGYRALPFLATMRVFGPMPWDEAPEADLLARMGKLEESETAAARTLARNPGDAEALAVQAFLRALRGETESAVRPLERASHRNPYAVVNAARHPAFAGLNRSPWFAPLLSRAEAAWQAQLLAIRQRPGIAQSGA